MGDGSRIGLSSSVLFCLVSVSIKIIIIIIKDSEQIFLMFEEKNTKVIERIVK